MNEDPKPDAAEAEAVARCTEHGFTPDPYEHISGLLHTELEQATGDPRSAIDGRGTETGMAEAFGVDRSRELQEQELAISACRVHRFRRKARGRQITGVIFFLSSPC